MRQLISIIALCAGALAAGRSAAQPAGPPDEDHAPCAVAIVRAPDDVRREIESWVARETDCRVALDVRVVPTDGGLYLLARESTGRIHERLVPDAQAAGVLVASWVADDQLEAVPPTPPPPPGAVVLPIEVETPPAPAVARVVMVPVPEAKRWGLGAMAISNDTTGIRARGTLEVLREGALAIDVIVGGSYSAYNSAQFDNELMRIHRVDGRALVGVSWTARQGSWWLRLGGAIGGVWSHAIKNGDSLPENWRAMPVEASLALGAHVSDRWSVAFAPVATWYRLGSSALNKAALPGDDFGLLMELRHGL